MQTSIEKNANIINQTKLTQQYSSTIPKNKKHSQYEFKSPYNTMQATRLLQHNNPPQNQLPTSQYIMLTIHYYSVLG